MSSKLSDKLLKVIPPDECEPERIKHILHWEEAAKVFYEELNEKEREALCLIESEKWWVLHKRYALEADKIIERLKQEGLIVEEGNKLKIFRDDFKEYIKYHCKGRLALLPKILLKREPKDLFTFDDPLTLTMFALIILISPSICLISSLLTSVHTFLDSISKFLTHVNFYLVLVTLSLLFFPLYFFYRKLLWFIIPSIVASLLLWIGFDLFVVLLLLLPISVEVMGFYLLRSAYQSAKSLRNQHSRRFPEKMYKFLEVAISKETWGLQESKMREWPPAKTIIFLLLFIPGFLLFIHILAPREIGPETIEPEDVEITILYPSWLSYRDTANLVVSLRNVTNTGFVTGTALLESDDSLNGSDGFLIITAAEQIWGPLWPENQEGKPTTQVLRWDLHTVPMCSFRAGTRWNLRLEICESSPRRMNCDSREISIPRLRLGFGLWGFLQQQPLVNIIAMVFSIAYAALSIWLSQKLVLQETKSSSVIQEDR